MAVGLCSEMASFTPNAWGSGRNEGLIEAMIFAFEEFWSRLCNVYRRNIASSET
jgi:hypothetical protein